MTLSYKMQKYGCLFISTLCLGMIIFTLTGCQALLSYLPTPPAQGVPIEAPLPVDTASSSLEASPTATPSSSLSTPLISSPGKGILSDIVQTPDKSRYLYTLEGFLVVVDATNLKEVGKIESSCIPTTVFSPNSRYIALECKVGTQLADLKEFQMLGTIGPSTNGSLKAIEFSNDSRRIVYKNDDHTTGSFYQEIGVWDIETKQDVYRLDYGEGDVTNVEMTIPTIDPDQRRISAAYGDTNHAFLMTWDFNSGELLWKSPSPAKINSVDFSPDGSRIASGDEGGMIRLWNPRTGQETTVFGGFRDSITDIHFQNVNLLEVQVEGQYPQVLNLKDGSINEIPLTGQGGQTISPLEKELFSQGFLVSNTWGLGKLEFSPDGSILAKGDARVSLWDVEEGTGLQLYNPLPDQNVLDLAFSPDSKLLAVLGSKGGLVVLNLITGDEFYRGVTSDTIQDFLSFEQLYSDAEPMDVSPDGNLLAVGVGTRLQLIDLVTGTTFSSGDSQQNDGLINNLEFSQGGNLIYTALNKADRIQIWDTATATPIDEITLTKLNPGDSASLDLSWPYFSRRNGNQDEDWLELWNLETLTYQKIQVLSSSPYFTPDGRFLYTFVDNSLCAWRTSDGTFIGQSSESINSMSTVVSQDGRRFAYSAVETGHLSIIDISAFVARLEEPGALAALPPVIPYAPEVETPESVPVPLSSLGPEIPSGKTFFEPATLISLEKVNRISEAGYFGPGTINSLRWKSDNSLAYIAGSHNLATFDLDEGLDLLVERNASFSDTVTLPNGRLIAAGTMSGSVFVYDIKQDLVLISFEGGGEPALSQKGNILAYETPEHNLKTYDLQNNREMAVMLCQKTPTDDHCILHPVFSPDGNLVASPQTGNIVRIWNTKTGVIYNALGGPDAPVTDLSFSADGRYLVAAAAGSAWIWNVEQGGETRQIALFEGAVDDLKMRYVDTVTAAVLGPANKLLAVGTSQHDIRIYNLAGGNMISLLTGHVAPVTHLAFDPAGKRLLSSDQDGSLILWNLASGAIITKSDTFTGPIADIVVRQDGSIAALGENTAWVIDPASAALQKTTPSFLGKILAASPDGKYLVVYQPYQTYLVDANSGELLATLEGEAQDVSVEYHNWDEAPRQFFGAEFSHDSRLLATFASGGLWLHETGETTKLRKYFEGTVTKRAIFSPDDRFLIFSSEDFGGELSQYDLDNDDEKIDLDVQWIEYAAYSGDGKWLACIVNNFDAPNQVLILSTANGEIERDFSLDTDSRLTVLSYNLYDALIAVGMENGNILLLDAATGRIARELSGHTGSITALAFTPEGRYLVVGSADGTVSFWAVYPE